MWRVSIRNLLGHKVRMLTTGLAVVIGVAFLSGTLVLRATMQRTFDDLFAGVYRNTDAMVRAKGQFDDPSGFGVQRARLPEDLLATVQAVKGVAAAQPEVTGYAQVVGRDGTPVGNPQNGPPAIGGNWPSVPELSPWHLVAGRAPAADDEVVLDRKTAEVAGYGVGDTAKVIVIGPPQTVRISGIAAFGGAGGFTGGATFVIFTTAAAQKYVGEPGKIEAVSVLAKPGVSQAALVRNLRAALPSGVEAVTGATVTKENQDAVAQGMSVFNTFMLVFALVALFVGAYIVFNTFFITVAQRSRENALLRAIGASRKQVLASVLVEATGVGLIASVLGMFGGVAVAAGLKALLVAFGFDLPVTGIVLSSSTAVIALVSGMVVTVGAAVLPARRAGRVPPVTALRDLAVSGPGYGSRQRVMVGFALLALGLGSLFTGLSAGGGWALPMVGFGAAVIFFAVTVLGRTISLPMSRVIGWPIARSRGVVGSMARENSMRNPKRTAATASALMIGVGLVSFIAVFAASTKASISDTIDHAFLGDFAITSPAMAGNGGLDPGLAERLNTLPEVDVAGAIRMRAVQIDGSPVQLLAADLGAFSIFDVKPRQGAPADLDADSIGVFEDMAKSKGLHLGDTIPVDFVKTGRQQLRVAMIYGENVPAGNWVVGMPAFEKNVAERYDFQVFVRRAAGVPAAPAKAAVERVVDAYPGAKHLDQTEYKAEQSKFVDQMLGLIYALLALAILIALLGIGNTLALSILERMHELGVLRAVGMTRAQLRAAVRWESVIIAVQGSVLGLVVGIFLGWALVRALGDEGITTLAVPPTTMLVVLLVGAGVGVAASVLPARLTARLDVLRAIAST
jgi:putative ABC transport system permease protein